LFLHAVCRIPPTRKMRAPKTTVMVSYLKSPILESLLDVLRLNLSAMREAGIEPTKALAFISAFA
jgi:hypothetical protein